MNYTAANLGNYEPSGSGANPAFRNTASLPTGFTGTYPGLTPNTDGLSLQAGSVGLNTGAPLVASYADAEHQQRGAAGERRLGYRRL